MKISEEQLRKYIREVINDLDEEEIDEATATGNVDGYMTPHAFSKDGETDDDYIDRLNKSTGYTRVNEAHDGLTKKQIKKELEFIDRLLKKAKLSDKQHKDAVKEKERLESLLNENTAPKNWKKLTKEKEKEDEQEYKNRWLELKRSEGTPNQKIGVGIRKIRRELAEMEKFVNWYSKIRTMNELDKDDYWKRTQKHLKKIKERLIGFAHKIQELDRPIDSISESTITESDDIVKIGHGGELGGFTWYMKRIDGTHLMSSDDKDALRKGRGAVYHVGQLRDKPYYDDVRKWLHGKKDIDGNDYKD